jgi:hypothetical protein
VLVKGKDDEVLRRWVRTLSGILRPQIDILG